MKTVAILSQKGGTGKTTLAVHLALAAERRDVVVAVLDLDPQASAAEWKDSRDGDTPSVTSIQSSRLGKALEVAESAGAALIVIDTAPHSADAAVAAAEAADLILIPCRAGNRDDRAHCEGNRQARFCCPEYVPAKLAAHRRGRDSGGSAARFTRCARCH